MDMIKAKLADITIINPTLSDKLADENQQVAFVPMASVLADPPQVKVAESRILSSVKSGFSYFQDGDILVAKITPCFENGKIAQARIKFRHGFGSTEFHVVRPKNDQLDGRYLLHFIRQNYIRRKGERRMTGSAGQRRVPKAFLESLEIYLPPIAEQRRIAAILDKAEELRELRRQALRELDAIAQSIFIEMFGDPATNPKDWERKSIKELGQVITGNTPPRAQSELYGDAIEWIKSDNINTPYHYLTKASEGLSEAGKKIARVVPPSSILVTCIAGTPDCIGNAAIVDREVAFNQQINALIPSIGDFRFLYSQILVGKHLIQEASTSSMKGMVNKSRFEEVLLIYPPVDLQEEYGQAFDKIEQLKTTHRESLAQLDALFASLQHRAFRGEL